MPHDDPASDVCKITPLFPPTYFTLEHEARNLVEQLERHARTSIRHSLRLNAVAG